MNGGRLVLGKVVAGLGTHQDKYFLQCVFGFGCRNGCGPRGVTKSMGYIGHELGRHLGRRKLVIHQAGGNGAARHAVVLCGTGVLGHNHATLALDGPHAQSAVAAGAGEHNADGPFMLVLGQGTKEEVNRQTLTTWGGWLHQLERTI